MRSFIKYIPKYRYIKKQNRFMVKTLTKEKNNI